MSIKDALLKAGLRSSKVENDRKPKKKFDKTKVEKHQEQRNFCEVCETIQPDVEKFKHRNPRIDAEWICVNCADINEILDDFRVTSQSDHNKTKRYRRFYGHTRDFDKESRQIKKDDRDSRRPRYKHERSASDSRGNRYDNRRSDNRSRRNNRNGNSKAKYTIDENGEKNFNC